MPRNADYTHMRCRYCGKELALLKRLTGGGEFCSDSHKQSYQDEYNRLALGRLLQAQKISQAESTGKKPLPTPAARVAVEEPATEQARPQEHAKNGSASESLPLEISSLEGSVAEQPAAPQAPPETEAEPLELADFLVEVPVTAVLGEEAPYLETWLEFTSGPAVADYQFQNESATLLPLPTELLSLDLQPNAAPAAEQSAASANLTPHEFSNGLSQPTLPGRVSASHHFPAPGPIFIEVPVSVIEFAADQSIAGELDFETFVVVEDSRLLELPGTGIEFPAEDSGVEVDSEQDYPVMDYASSESESEDDSPRASLEALSRLHQNLVQEEEVEQEEPRPEAEQSEPVADDTAPEEEPSGETTPGRATDLMDLTIRMFPPPKPAPIAGFGLPDQTDPLLPNLKSWPLRPKVAVATGYVPPSTTAAPPKGTPSASPTPPQPKGKDGRAAAPSKTAPAVRPAARIAQPKQPATPVKVVPVSSVKNPEPAAVEATKLEVSKPAAKFQPAASKAAPPTTAKPETPSPKPEVVEAAAQPAKQEVEEAAKEIAKPADRHPVKQPPNEPTADSVPNFGSQLPNSGFAGSLKVKLGIAIVLLIGACSFWLGWGGKGLKPASNGTMSADAPGPSIIMGEGGWVEGWGGDPSGLHAGRQITIYRPSLKLSDYRIEFQGSIETQSIGWVFRAADPENYYALKLLTVSSGLSPRVALFKYLVLNGRQTQVGRVPIDLPIHADTVFNIRTDVRGPQFSTYIQGRQVDVWTDDQLKAGGVGFLNEREERGKVKSVSIRYLNGAK